MRLKDKYASTMLLGKVIAVPLGKSMKFKGTLRMNGTGAEIFEMLKQDTTEEEIVDALGRRYDTPRDTLRRDVRACLEKFRSRGLLE